MKLNEAQSKAVSHVDGPMMVIAGPGSGKTTVITKRIKYLIESAGVSPADILVITFTRAAAGEMQQRFRAMTPGKEYPVRFGTFHSIFYWILKTAYGQSMLRVISEEEKRGPYMECNTAPAGGFFPSLFRFLFLYSSCPPFPLETIL